MCLSLEPSHREIPHQQQVTLRLEYEGHTLRQTYRDLITFASMRSSLKEKLFHSCWMNTGPSFLMT
ncbi:MAG: hypothetical protein AAGG48_04515 [Planctomycetota bacterium]